MLLTINVAEVFCPLCKSIRLLFAAVCVRILTEIPDREQRQSRHGCDDGALV